MTSPLTVKQLVWLCAMYSKECDLSTNSSYGNPSGEPWHPSGCPCGGTMLLPLLGGVQEKCLICPDCSPQYLSPASNPFYVDARCYGLRWKPTEDVWKWLEAVYRNVADKRTPIPPKFYHVEGAFFADLEASLRPIAVNAAEAEKWTRENIL